MLPTPKVTNRSRAVFAIKNYLLFTCTESPMATQNCFKSWPIRPRCQKDTQYTPRRKVLTLYIGTLYTSENLMIASFGFLAHTMFSKMSDVSPENGIKDSLRSNWLNRITPRNQKRTIPREFFLVDLSKMRARRQTARNLHGTRIVHAYLRGSSDFREEGARPSENTCMMHDCSNLSSERV